MTKQIPLFVCYRVILDTDEVVAIINTKFIGEDRDEFIYYTELGLQDIPILLDYILYNTRPASIKEFSNLQHLVIEEFKPECKVIAAKDIGCK